LELIIFNNKKGTETADQRARTGSEHPFTGPEPACGISIGVSKKAVRDGTNRNHKKYWEFTTGLKQTKGLLLGPSARRTKDLLKLNRDQLRWVAGLLTGHYHQKGHLFKLGLTEDPICERCQEEDESATHILYDYEAIAYLKFRHLGQFFMEPSDYNDSPIYKVLQFIRGAGLIKGLLKGEPQEIIKVRGARAGFYGSPLIRTYIHTYVHTS
jgi:hypothetical protein